MVERTTQYEDDVGTEGDRIRVRFATERGAVTAFMVQYEILHEGTHYLALRYDSAHGAAHLDVLDWSGETIEKRWIEGKTFAEAFTDAQEQIKANWRQMKAAFYRRKR